MVQSKEKKPEQDILSLLDFVSSYRELEGGKPFFKNLDDFFSSLWKKCSFIVYSLLKSDDPEQSLNRRLLWNRHEVGKFHPDILKGEAVVRNGYFLFPLGEEKLQKIFGVIKTDETIDPVFGKYLKKFLVSQQERVKEFKKLKKFEYLIEIDSATGLFNQQKLFRDIEMFIDDYQKYGEGFALLFIDIDHFGLVNEKYGHVVGSETLANLAILLKKILRDNDLIYRYGGDEFVIIVKDITPESVYNVAKRVLEEVGNHKFHTQKHSFDQDDKNFQVSVSIGVSICPQDVDSEEDMLILADKRMYEAKDAGRNRVCGSGLLDHK